MLTSTFIHAPGVGPATERDLWSKGIRNWSDSINAGPELLISKAKRTAIVNTAEASVAALTAGNVAWFADALPKREHWRSVSHFGERIGYLDIETDGGMDGGAITLIGLGDGHDVSFYVKGQNLEQFASDMLQFDSFVTFFGTGFDVPMLIRRFPSLKREFDCRFHIDLCPLLRRIGYRGGLKKIETALGIRRVPEAEGLDGMDAVRLWHVWMRGAHGSEEAMEQLLAYNKEDVVNMQALLKFAVPKLMTDAGMEHTDLELVI